MERVRAGFRPLRGVPKRLKSLFTSAMRDRIFTLLQQAISEFLSTLNDIARKLHVDNYSIGVTAAFVQFALTFKVP
jgi:hypothetical protein